MTSRTRQALTAYLKDGREVQLAGKSIKKSLKSLLWLSDFKQDPIT
jgi:hypothetical protein